MQKHTSTKPQNTHTHKLNKSTNLRKNQQPQKHETNQAKDAAVLILFTVKIEMKKKKNENENKTHNLIGHKFKEILIVS